ncbi:hypothetical protein KCM76_21125, partial [Zooshikella marina]|uniref:hypothetical protein n=1 Tax=Zooshikella ganghwensis TaxID=202772 RepID=UPI001C04C967
MHKKLSKLGIISTLLMSSVALSDTYGLYKNFEYQSRNNRAIPPSSNSGQSVFVPLGTSYDI